MRKSRFLRAAVLATTAAVLVAVLAGPAFADIKLQNLTISPTSTTATTPTAFTLTFLSKDGSNTSTPDANQKPLCLVFTAPGFGSFTSMSLSASPVAASGWTGSTGPGANQFKLVAPSSAGPAIAGGDTVTVHVTATAPASGSFKWSVVGYDNTACNSNASGTLNASANVTVGAAPSPHADLGIVKTASPNPVPSGDDLTYTLTVTNHGPDTSGGSTVTDTLPAGVTFKSASAGCTGTTTITCTVGSLTNGSSVVFTIVVTVTAAEGTVISNTATVAGASSSVDSNTGNNSSTTSTTTGPPSGAGNAFQPDEWIKLKKQHFFKGNDIYNGTGGRQTTNARAHHRHSKTSLLVVQNDGTATDTIIVTGQGHRPGFSIKYFHGKQNITNDVVSRVYTLNLAPGETSRLRVVITVLRGARVGLVRSWQIEARSSGDPTKRDVVKAKLGVLKH